MQSTKRMTFLIVSALMTLGAVTGCDQSKAELDTTKQQLTAITAERDGLKSQLDAAKQQVTTLTAQVTDLQAKLAAAQTPPPPPPPVVEEKGAKKKKAAKAEPAAAATPAAPAAPGDHHCPDDGNPQGPGSLLGRSREDQNHEISTEDRIHHDAAGRHPFARMLEQQQRRRRRYRGRRRRQRPDAVQADAGGQLLRRRLDQAGIY